MTTLGQLIATGTRSTVHAVGTDMVAKVPLATTPDSWIRHEAMYTAAVRSAGAPAPQVADVVEIDGRTVSLYERIRGVSMWEYILDHPDEAAALGLRLAELHIEVLRLAPPVTLPRQRDRLACKIRTAASLVEPAIGATLAQIPPDPDRLHLCHGDVHPGNVILSSDGPVLIDWFDACRGNPAGDIARTQLLTGAGGATVGSVAHLPQAQLDVLNRLHRAYADATAAAFTTSDADAELWRGIEAAARLGEGLDTRELLAVWRETVS